MLLLVLLLRIALALTVLSVLALGGIYLVRFYELATGGQVRPMPVRRLQAASLGRSISAFAREWAASVMLVAMRPLGWGGAVGRFGPTHAGGLPPVVMIEGYLMNRSCFLPLVSRLRRIGRTVYTVNVPTLAPFEEQASRLAAAVTDVVRETGIQRVDLVGFSLGGVVARYFVERMGGHERVGRVVTIASSHNGTRAATLAIGASGRDAVPGSEALADLHAAGFSEGVTYTSIHSMFDPFVLPPQSAHLPPPATNVEVPDTGHSALLFSRRAGNAVVEALA